ncbi:hypothetical protein RYH80_04230 [Halobaculum sp. MBLA0147]|uniref:DUF7331 family protein n=1 Tax=Halobaculum sp. MBLA0147 TaxID=3079934 RepID=UPI00352525B9
MTPPTDSSWDAAGDAAEPETAEAVEMYEDDGRVVLFDSENPLAWLEASRTVTVTDLV